MKVDSVKVIYFSPTGGTKKLALKFGKDLGGLLDVPVEELKLNQPEARKEVYHFKPNELIVLACPTYAGRVPNKIAPDLRSCLHFDGSPAAALVSFGNRSFGTAPEELADILKEGGARVIACGAFAVRHSFSGKVGRGRPDRQDKAELTKLAEKTANIINGTDDPGDLKCFSGEIGEYYRPLKEDGTPAMFLKAKPLTHEEKCYHCGLCVKSCPMGAIDPDCVTVTGTCIKCQACIHSCPTFAKYFDDPDFLSHVRMLEQHYTERAENKIF